MNKRAIPCQFEAGKTLRFCSDAVTTRLDDVKIASLIRFSRDRRTATRPWVKEAKHGVKEAKHAGGGDNISVIVFRAKS